MTPTSATGDEGIDAGADDSNSDHSNSDDEPLDEQDGADMSDDDGWEPIEVRVLDDEPDSHSVVASKAASARVIAFPDEQSEPVVGPGGGPDDDVGRLPRLARHTLTLPSGHQVGVAVSGRGVPFVIVHGFSAEGMLYAQTLSRLVSMGFKVVAIDVAGHGGTQGLPTGGANLASYTNLLAEALDTLGIERAILAGHSMGGRLVTQLAAGEPQRAIAVILLDAIVGDTWDRMINVSRVFPPILAGVAGILAVDTLSTIPVFGDPAQAAKLARLVTPTLIGHVRRPWRLLGPAVSMLRSRGSRWMLEKLAQERVPVFVIHGDRDFAVPLATGRDAARRSNGQLTVVHKASHSWLLKDPEAVPGIVLALMKGKLGTAVLRALLRRGIDPAELTLGMRPADGASDEVDLAFCAPDALVLRLTPPQVVHDTESLHRPAKYRWTLDADAM
jgi:pimeloyl-ACP methyl ester carboxylesterase